MTTEGIKEEIKLNTEILKFLLIVLLASAGGMVTLSNTEKQSHIQQVFAGYGLDIYTNTISGNFSTFFICLFVVKEIVNQMETLLNIGPWITLIISVAVVLFFCGFYMIRLYRISREQNSFSRNYKKHLNQTDSRQKLKADILLELEKKLEAL